MSASSSPPPADAQALRDRLAALLQESPALIDMAERSLTVRKEVEAKLQLRGINLYDLQSNIMEARWWLHAHGFHLSDEAFESLMAAACSGDDEKQSAEEAEPVVAEEICGSSTPVPEEDTPAPEEDAPAPEEDAPAPEEDAAASRDPASATPIPLPLASPAAPPEPQSSLEVEWPPGWFEGLRAGDVGESKRRLDGLAAEMGVSTLAAFYARLTGRSAVSLLKDGAPLYVMAVEPKLMTRRLEVVGGPGYVCLNTENSVLAAFVYIGADEGPVEKLGTFKRCFKIHISWEGGTEIDFVPGMVGGLTATVAIFMVLHVWLLFGCQGEAKGVMLDADAKAQMRALVPDTAAGETWWSKANSGPQCAHPANSSASPLLLRPGSTPFALSCCRTDGGSLGRCALLWLGTLRAADAIPDLGCPESSKPTVASGSKMVKAPHNFLCWTRSTAILRPVTYAFYVTHLGHDPAKGLDPCVDGAFVPITSLTRPWAPPQPTAPPSDGAAAPQLSGVHLFQLFGWTGQTVSIRLNQELRPLHLEASSSARQPSLAAHMHEMIGGRVLPATRLETRWRDWLTKKRMAEVYTQLKYPGMATELLRILVHGPAADFAFSDREMAKLFKQFLAEVGWSQYLISTMHMD